ncbi:MAG: response regulator [Dehalococcoidia bacterium]|nr:response regulator [Dehalococcoidia bacterium]
MILAADDDPGLLKVLELELTSQGFRLERARTGEDAISAVMESRPDLLLLDVMLPDISGFEVLRRVQERSHLPIILLTGKDADADKVRGLELGADDYLVKPFNPTELTARVRAVLRRARRTRSAEGTVRVHDLEIDLDARVVTRQGEVVRLTRNEWKLLEVLAERAGKVLQSEEILARVWGPEYRDDLQYLRVWVARLRRKVDPHRSPPELITTFPGFGYMLGAPNVDDSDRSAA